MSSELAAQKRLVIVGATGMVGGYVPRYALGHPAIGRVTAFVLRSLGISHPKLCTRGAVRAMVDVAIRATMHFQPNPRSCSVQYELRRTW